MYTDLYLIVEAENEHEAYDIARETDGGEFIEETTGGDWKLNDVIPVD